MEFEIIKIKQLSGKKAQIYSVILGQEDQSVFEQFLQNNYSEYPTEIEDIVSKLKIMATKTGAAEHFFKLNEGKPGESQARNKYTYFASVAKKEGYEQMSALFLKTADNEKEHAKMWFKELAGLGDTKSNLADAAEAQQGDNRQGHKAQAGNIVSENGNRKGGGMVSLPA